MGKGDTGNVRPQVPTLEQLEPRILLNADFVGIEPLSPLDVRPCEQVIEVDLYQHEQAAEEADPSLILEYLASSEEPEEALISQGEQEQDEGAAVDSLAILGDSTVEESMPSESLGQAGGGTEITAGTDESTAQFHEQSACLAPVDRQDDISSVDGFPIEARGPPAEPCDALTSLSATTYTHQSQFCALAEVESTSASNGAMAPDLPGMDLVDPDLSSWQGQIIYLDFHGEQNVTYNGPTTIGPFDIPAFQAPGELSGSEAEIIGALTAGLNALFAGTGVLFTLDRPQEAGTYSTVYIGGDGSWAAEHGSFYGLAEQVDIGNQDRADNAFAFAGRLSSPAGYVTVYADTLANLIAHEVGHLLGYAHSLDAVPARVAEAGGNLLMAVASSIDDSAVNLQDGGKWLSAMGVFDGTDHIFDFSAVLGDYTALGLTVEGSETPWPITGMQTEGTRRAMTLGDFNGDGHLDILVIADNHGDWPTTGQLVVWANNGDGTFTAGDPISVPAYVTHVAVGDVNGDGHMDVVATTLDEDDWPPAIALLVLPGDGAGNFGDLIEIALPGNVCGLAVGDVNGVNGDDIVVAYGGAEGEAGGAFFLRTYLADGEGGFSEPQDLALSEEGPNGLVLGDLDGDGRLDAVVSNGNDWWGTNTVSVLLGQGDGAFGTERTFITGDFPQAIALADLNGNGTLDLVTASRMDSDWSDTDSVSVLMGTGDGGFGPPTIYRLGGDAPNCLALGDINGDGFLDIVTSSEDTKELSFLYGDGTGRFEHQGGPEGELTPIALALGDLTGNGALDIVTISEDWDDDWNTLTAISVFCGRPAVMLELLDPSGNLITVGTDEGGFTMPQVIRGYVAGATGVYSARVSGGEPGMGYTLTVTIDADFELPPPADQPFDPQDISAIKQVVGHLGDSATRDVRFSDSETFEMGALGSDWTIWSSDAQGRIQITGDYETASGDYALVMDRDYSSSDSTLNEAVWTVDLSGASGAVLSFWHAEWNDVEDPFSGGVFVDHDNADGIAISADGTNWHPVWEPEDGDSGQWSYHVIDLGAPALAAGIALGEGFQIKFQQYGVWGGRGWDEIVLMTRGDAYGVAVEDGDSLVVTVATLDHAPGEPANDLVAKLVVTDESGTVVGQDDDLDGHLALTTGSSGFYTVFVDAVSGAGDYVLYVTGATGTIDEPFEVTGSNVTADTLLATFPDLFILDFSQPVDLSSLSPGDLTINGAPAQAVTVLGAARLGFDIAALNTGSGSYEAAVEAGALSSIAGEPVAAFSLAFETDTTPPAVTDISLTEGDIFAPGEFTVTITFSKELATDGLDAEDVELRRNIADGGWLNPDTFEYTYDPDTGESTLELTFLYLWEGPYTLTLVGGNDAFRDPAGNLLDGDGDGVGGDDFELAFNVDHPEDRAVPTPFAWRPPAGGRVYHSPWTEATRGVLHGPDDVDTFTVPFEGGQAATIRLELGGSGGEEAGLELLGPDDVSLGTALATTDAEGILRMIPLPSTGIYSIRVTGISGAAQYYVYIQLNADVETEPNDSLAQAQVLPSGPAGAFYAVTGSAQPGNPDYYAFDLSEGDAASLTVAVYSPDRPIDLTLLDATGTVLAIGVEDAATNADEFICSFIAPYTGIYYACIVGESESMGVGYTLVVTIDHETALEPNETIGDAQQLQAGWGAVGFINDPGYSVYPGQYEVGADLRTAVPGVTLMVLDGDGNVQPGMVVSAGSDSQFNHSGGSDWRSRDQTLRVVFDSSVDTVSIDIICSGQRYGGFLNAYSADGERLQNISTDQWANGPQTLTIRRSIPDIAYIEASGMVSYWVGLTNLVVGSNHADVYMIQFAAGEAVTLTTGTPGYGQEGVPFHDLDPRLVLYDMDGAIIAANDNGAFDGRNALLSFTAGADPYFVEVSGRGRGDYQLHIQGTLIGANPVVVATSPGADTVVAHAPAVIEITFSERFRSDQLDPADLTVTMAGTDIRPATAVEQVDAFTVRYTVGLDAADLEGPYSFTLAPGAVFDLQGTASSEYNGEFFVDRTGPWVTTESPLPAVGAPFGHITVEFSEPILPASATPADVSVTGPSGEISVSRVEVEGSTLTIVVNPRQNTEGTYTFTVGPDVTDFVGNPMDQNRNGVYGEEDDSYTGRFELVLPDLVVDTVTVNPVAASVGQTVDVTWLARNDSSMETPSDWSVYFWLSNDTTLDIGSDVYLYEMVAGAPVPMGQDTTHGATTLLTIPVDPSIIEGTNYILVQVNALNEFVEGDQDNNVGFAELQITGSGLPDLVMDASIDDDVALLGGTVSAHWTVTNTGAAPTDQTWQDQVRLSLDETFSSEDIIVASYDAADHLPLGVGESYVVDMDLTMPTSVTPGNYFLLFIADRRGDQVEETTNNNVVAVPITLTASDLTVEWLKVPADAVLGETIEVAWRVHNEGNSAVEVPWSDQVLLSEGDTIDGGIRILAEIDTTATIPLGPGEHHDQTALLTLPLVANIAPGAYYLIVHVDRYNAVAESDEDNNATAVGIDLVLPPLPDLAVTAIEVPAEAWSGMRVPVQWEVTNVGDLAASGSWRDAIYLADNPEGAVLNQLGSARYDAGLVPDESVLRTHVIDLPSDLQGNWWVVVVTDVDYDVFEHASLANNTAVADEPLVVHISEFPNLVVSDVSAPANAFAGQTILVEWTVTNTGSASTNVPYWVDRIYLSENLGSMGRPLENVPNGSHLAPGESYRTSQSITLPHDEEGLFYIRIKTDVADHVLEFGHEHDNVGDSGPMTVAMPPVPDLQVTQVFAPPTAFSGQQVALNWTVTNLGEVAVNEPQWYDTVYLSEDKFIDGDDPVLMRRVYHNGPLAPGESSEASCTVTLPLYIEGPWYFIVLTDAGGQVFEHVFAGNNRGVAPDPTEIFLTPPPDLEVEEVSVPEDALSGRDMEFTYRVANHGSLATDVDRWVDEFYISLEAEFDIETATLIGSAKHVGVLEVGASYEKTVTATLPDGISGEYYLFVRTDVHNAVYELDTDNNLLRSSGPIAVTTAPADLVVESVSAPETAEAGEMILVTWTVKNIGVGDTALQTWADKMVLHGPGGRSLATFVHIGLLDVEESYTRSELVTIPSLLAAGPYSITVETNVDRTGQKKVYEGANTDNNTSVALPITVTANPADLLILGEVDAPTTARSGEVIQVSWTVLNDGDGDTQARGWHDRVYLAESTTLNPETDILLGSFKRSNPLEALGQYDVTREFTIPIDASGEFYAIVWTDAGQEHEGGTVGAVAESDETNNTAVAAAPLVVLLSPVPDLVVEQVNAPDAAVTGQAVEVTWTVRNDGADADDAWVDKLYLSRDLILDPTDAYLDQVRHEDGLAAGETYEKTATVYVPAGYSGNLFVFVVTNANNAVYERGAIDNNTNFDPNPMVTVLALPVDLAVIDITVPATGMPGIEATIEYTVRNDHATHTIEGFWHDSLYLSADEQWDIDDPLIDSGAVYRRLAPGESYTRTVVVELPAAVPGDYYVIVRTDIRNAVRETDETNNALTSPETIALDGQELILGTPHAGTIAAGQSAYFYVEVPAGETLYVALDSASETASNELYLRYGDSATRSRHDMSGPAAFSPDQRIAVEETGQGRYYILVYCADEANDYTIEARLLEFEITDEGYGRGGNAGNFTFAVNGAKFDRSVTATLTDGSGFVLPAESYHYASTIRFYPTFDLTRLEPGMYDLVLTSGTLGEETRLADALEVVSITEENPQVWLNAPSWVLVGANYHFHVSWTNYSLNDVSSPLLVLHSAMEEREGQVYFSPDPGRSYNRTNFVFYGAGRDDGPSGILRPGQTESIIMYGRGTGPGSIHVFRVANIIPDPDLPFDWAPVYDDLRDNASLADVSSSAFDVAFDWMRAQVGETWGDYHAMLSRNATLVPWETGRPSATWNLHEIEFIKALVATGAGISGQGFAYDMAVDLSGRLVTAHNTDTGEIFQTHSLTDGTFFFHSLGPGTYSLTFDEAVILSGGTVVITEGEPADGVVLELSRGSRINGTVLDVVSGTAVAGANVVLRYDNGDIRWTETDETGAYAFTALPAGVCSLSFELQGFAPTVVEGIVLGQTDTVTHNGSLAVTAKIQGTVELQAPAPEGYDLYIAAHRVGGDAYQVSIDGLDFSLAQIPGGIYSLTFFRFGYVVGRLDGLQVVEGEVLDVGIVDLDRAARIEGTVDLQVSPDASEFWLSLVAAWDGDEMVAAATVDSNGNYLIDNVPAGDYTVRIASSGMGVSTEQQVTLYPGSWITGVNLALMPGGAITGAVTNTAADAPAKGVTVQLVGPDGLLDTTITNQNGIYRFEQLAAGSYRVGLTTGGADGSGVVAVVDLDGTALDLDLAYGPVATLGGTLLASSGQPVSDGIVTLYRDDAPVATAQGDDNGRFEFALFQGGTFVIGASSDNAVFQRLTDLVVAPGEDVAVVLTAGSGSLVVAVDDPAGPVAGTAIVRVESLIGAGAVVSIADLDEGQTWTFDNLAAGDYRVEVWTLDGRVGTGVATVVEGQAAAVTATIGELHAVTGRITDTGGAPLSDAWIILTSTDGSDLQLVAISGPDGYYEIDSVDAGNYDLVVLLDGYGAAVVTNVVVADDAELDVTLADSTTTITGRIVTSDGTPLAGATVIVLDAEGREIGYAVAGEDGVFTITTASGDGLTLQVAAEGFALFERTDVEVVAGDGLDLADLDLAAVALAQAPTTITPEGGAGYGASLQAAAVPIEVYECANDETEKDTEIACFSRPMEPLSGPDGSVGYPLYLDYFIDKIFDGERLSGEVTSEDLGELPDKARAKCSAAYSRAEASIRQQDVYWDAISSYSESVYQHSVIVLGLFGWEILSTIATLASAALVGTKITALLGFGVAQAALATVSVKITSIVAAVISGIGQVVASILESTIAADPAGSKSCLEQAETILSTGTVINDNIDALVSTLKGVVNGWKDSGPGAFGKASVLGILSLAAGWRKILQYATITNTRESLGLLDSAYQGWKKATERYEEAVRKAQEDLATYRDLIRHCKDDDEDGEDDRAPIPVIVPMDPNDIVGPEGVGEERWVAGDATLDYMIRFENDAELASAPARMVRITQQLDDDLDFRTFRVGNIGFGDIVVEVPANVPFFMTRLDLVEEMGFYLDIAAGINVLTGEATWVFTTIDPDTGALSSHPMLGFLPPNVESPEGQGWVTYTVRPDRDVQTGAVIDAEASIIFDTEDPIDTPPIFNTVDAVTPTSQVQALPGQLDEEEILVSWTGQDDEHGSSIAAYTIYVSESGGPFLPWLVETTATQAPFLGQAGHTYAFYCVAQDAAGNREPAIFVSHTTTLIGDDPDAPSASLAAPADGGPHDLDPAPNVVATAVPITVFEIQLADVGSGIDDATVDATVVSLALNGTPLVRGADFSFYYNSLNDLITLLPLGTAVFPDGVYTLTLADGAIRDHAGNPLAETVFVVTGDTMPPAVPQGLAIVPDTGVDPADGITNTGTLQLTGTLDEADLIVRVYNVTTDTDLDEHAATGTTFTVDLDLTHGEHQLRVIAEDALGNTSEPVFFDVLVDAIAPESAVVALPERSDTQFTVQWGGNDADSGIAFYDVYVSTDGGEFVLWQDGTTETSAEFHAAFGHSYGFYSRATDVAGNREQASAQADTTTHVSSSPVIGTLSASPDPVVRPDEVMLTATDVSDPDGEVVQVQFWRDVNGNGQWEEGVDELLGADTDGSDGWNWRGSTADWMLGEHTVFARAQDSDDEWSPWASATVTVVSAPLIGGWVWIDANNNGVQDPGELGVDAVPVSLYSADGVLIGTTTTSNGGVYTFADDLEVGSNYYLEFVAPAGYGFAMPNQETDEMLDSDPAIDTGRTATFTLMHGENLGWDAGLIALGSIGGVVWNDLNADGYRDAYEPLLSGWTVYVDVNGTGSYEEGVDPFFTTGDEGRYVFEALRPGTYTIREMIHEGWVQTYPGSSGTAGTNASLAHDAAYCLTGSAVEIFLPGGVTEVPHVEAALGLIRLDAFQADERFAGIGGQGYSVVVIDTGLDLSHPFFGPDSNGNGIADRILFQYDFADGDDDATDFSGHGSHVTSTIASGDTVYGGVAPEVGIIHLKVFSDDSRGYFSYAEQALQWVIDNASEYNIVAVNMSFGDGSNWQNPTGMYGIGDELATLAGMGIVTVAAAGNGFGFFGSTPGVTYPAADPNVVAVGAVWDSDRGGPWSFSGLSTDYTTGADRIASFSQRHAELLDVFAPGALITGANAQGGVSTMRGTSMAAPFVTGAAILAQQVAMEWLGRPLTPWEFAYLLQSTGVLVHDGDDEHDSVVNTQLTFARLDMLALAEAIVTFDSSEVPDGSADWGGDADGSAGPLSGTPFAHTIVLAAGQVRDNADFGNRPPNTAPVVDLGGDVELDEGDTFIRVASFTDLDAWDNWTATVDYGDGRGAQALELVGAAFVLDHVYLADGVYTVTVTVTDDDGGVGEDSLVVTVRDRAPTAILTGDTSLALGQIGTFDAGGSFSWPDAIVSYEWDWNYDGLDFEPSGDVGVIQSHAWLLAGTYTVAVRVTDEDGSTDIAALFVTVAPVAPGAPAITGIVEDTGIADDDGITNDSRLLIYGTAEAGCTVEVFLEGRSIGTATADDSGDWVFDYTDTVLADGAYSFTATATNATVNVSAVSESFLVTVDTVAPTVTVNSLNTHNGTPQLTGTVDDPDALVEVMVAGASYEAVNNGDGTWILPAGTISPALTVGSYGVIATATDTAGNTGTDPPGDELVIMAVEIEQPVHRFWSAVYSQHFYTIDEAEKDWIIETWSHIWTYEGVAFYAYSVGAHPAETGAVYRFWSAVLNSHFYTIDEAEKDWMLEAWSHIWTYEGVAFYAYPKGAQPAEASAVYRFWSPVLNSHFYTMDEAERDVLFEVYPHLWVYEGIAWYALPSSADVPVSVDNWVGVSLGVMRLGRWTSQTSIRVTVTNTSDTAITGPVWFVVEGISDSDVALAGHDGLTPVGHVYIDLTNALSDSRLDPGQSITIRLYFNNPLRRRFSFSYSIWGIAENEDEGPL